MSEEKDIVDLKPCPFCGGAAREPSIGGNGGDERSGYNYSVTVSCSNCGAQKTIYSKQGAGGWCNENTPDAKQRAIANWNARAEAASELLRLRGEVERLRGFAKLAERDGIEVGVSRQALDEVLAELKVCHEVIGAYVIAEAYADSFPNNAADAKDLKFCQHYWEGAASSWAGEDLLSRAHEAAKSRMRVENPVQVRDLDWSAAMGDVVASGGLPRDDDDDYDPPCTCCNGTGVNFQTERICTCTRAPSPKPQEER